MIGYASRTGTRRNLAALRAAGWRLLVSARGVLRTEGFRYALDNGAWTAHQRGEPFDVAAFEAAVALLGDGADWIVVPDVVMDARSTLDMADTWLPRLARYPLLVAVQNGITADDVRPWIGPRVGVFIGGDSAWKEASARGWGALCRERGAWLHMGRVNSRRRIAIAAEAGVDSIDGTSASRSRCRAWTPRSGRPRCGASDDRPRLPPLAWSRRAAGESGGRDQGGRRNARPGDVAAAVGGGPVGVARALRCSFGRTARRQRHPRPSLHPARRVGALAVTCHLEARRRDGVLRFRVWSTVSDTYAWAGEHPEGMLAHEVALYMEGRWHVDAVVRRIAYLKDSRSEIGEPIDLDAPWGEEMCGACLDWHRRDGHCVGWRD